MFAQRLIERGKVEFSRRLDAPDFWSGLEFSRATIFRSLLETATPALRRTVLGAHLQCAQIGETDNASPERTVVTLAGRLTEKLNATWRHMNTRKRQTLARQAIREKWSLSDGLSYSGYEGPEVYSRERLHQLTSDLNAKIRSDWSALLTAANVVKPVGPIAAEMLPPILTTEDIWGTPEEWTRFATLPPPPWATLKKELKRLLAPYYEEVTAPLAFLKQIDEFTLHLEIITGSPAGHFRYSYIVHDARGQIVLATSYETLLGLGLGIWDGISGDNIPVFCERLSSIDAFFLE